MQMKINEGLLWQKNFIHIYGFYLYVFRLLGIFLFIIPINTADGMKVPIALLANWSFWQLL